MTLQQAQNLRAVTPPGNGQSWFFQMTRATLLLLAVGLAVWGGVMAARLVFTPTLTTTPGETIQAGDLAFSIDSATWLSMDHGDHDSDPYSNVTLESDTDDEAAIAAASLGFSMPPSMMPGLPKEGQHRLRIEVTFQNTGYGRETIALDQFRVEAADGTVYQPLQNSSLRTQELVAGQGIGALLFVDVDETATAPRIIWERGGKQVALWIDGAPDHGH